MGMQLPLFEPKSDWTAPQSFPRLKGAKRISFDAETKDPNLDTLGPGVRRGAKIIGFSVGRDDGDGKTSKWYFPIRHEGGGNLDPHVTMNWAREELNAFDGEVVGANLGYDLDFTFEEGITFANAKAFHDVQVAEPLIDEPRLEYNLGALGMSYVGESKTHQLLVEAGHAYGFHTMKALKSNLWRLPARFVGPYGEGDADLPLRIFPLQEKIMRDEGLEYIYGIERQLIPILVHMRRHGVRIDVRAAEKASAYLKKKIADIHAEIRRLTGKRIELMAPASFVDILIDRGINVPMTEKTQMPSVTKPFLERHKKDDFVRLLLEGRKYNTADNTFFQGQIIKYAGQGRIHPVFRQSKSEDGGTIARLSGEHPNTQFIPKRDEEIGPMTRACFLPEEGEEWQRDDYSQIEYRLLAHFAVGPGADEIRQQYNDDPKTDYHKVAARLLNVDPSDKRKRDRVKITNFTKVYGAGVGQIADTFGCTEAEAKVFLEEYNRQMPFVDATYDKADEWAKKRGFVVTIMNRRQRFPFWEPFNNYPPNKKKAYPYDQALKEYGPRICRADTYKALNRKMQGSNADIIKKAMVDSWNSGINQVLGPHLITVHDELGSSVPRTKEGDEAGRELKNILEKVVTLRVPVMVESGRGANWSEAG